MACEGKLRELLVKAARRTHTQIPTFMTDGREIKKTVRLSAIKETTKQSTAEMEVRLTFDGSSVLVLLVFTLLLLFTM